MIYLNVIQLLEVGTFEIHVPKVNTTHKLEVEKETPSATTTQIRDHLE